DDYNLRDILRIVGNKHADKVHKLLDFTSTPRAIADPWYTRNFEVTFEDVFTGSQALLKHICESKAL
ncbi:MAG: low molecular weight phosphotyrosine protein phosphatase, partial [Clostridia bacterium]|nr:low molecular weight phosphotyrosine protein phosphatase [Clostridia bacterium]